MKGVEVKMNISSYEKNQLIEHLLAACAAETDKPYEEIDADFVEACTELILELQGKNFTLSNEELEEKVRQIPFVEVSDLEAYRQRKSKKINKRKILLVAAVIALLCALLSLISVCNEYDYADIFSFVRNKYGTMTNVPEGEPVTYGNQEIIIEGKPKMYTSIEDFCENESLYVLMPTGELPEGIEICNIMFSKKTKHISVSLTNIITCYTITLDSSVPQSEKDCADKTVEINGILCYVDNMPDAEITQIYFEHNGNYYTVSGTDEQLLLDFIKNLEETK